MTFGWRFGIVALMAGIAAARGGAQVPVRQIPPVLDSRVPRGTGLIVGRVVDAASGKPVRGVVVTIGGAGLSRNAVPPILTGSDGYFLFRDLPRGGFSITAEKRGYAPGSYGRRRPNGQAQTLTLADGERVTDAVVRIWKMGTIAGAVVDESGEPLVGITVRALRRTFQTGRRDFLNVRTVPTNDLGVYRLWDLPPGEYVVGIVRASVSVPQELAEQLRTRHTDWANNTAAAAISDGAVTLGDTLYSVGRGQPIPPPPQNDAMFVYPTTFYPASPTMSEAITVSLAPGEERTAVDLQLRPVPTVRVSGTVVGPDGPASSMLVRLLPEDGARGLDQDVPTAATGSNGAFVFAAVPAGHYVLSAATVPAAPSPRSTTPDTGYWAEVPVAVDRDDIDDVTVAMQPGIRVTGRIEFEGTAPRPPPERLRQVPIAVAPADRDPAIRVPAPAARVGSDGSFTTFGFAPGRYLLRVVASPEGWMFKGAMHGGRDVSENPLELRSGEVSGVVLLFTDRWTGLSGVVRTPDGAADADAAVLVFPTDTQAWTNYGPNPRRLRSARSAKTGEFSIPSLPPGDYYAIAVPDEQTADWTEMSYLQALARAASRVTIPDGQHKTVDLRTQRVR
jgi:carboxypeptidase family protein